MQSCGSGVGVARASVQWLVYVKDENLKVHISVVRILLTYLRRISQPFTRECTSVYTGGGLEASEEYTES